MFTSNFNDSNALVEGFYMVLWVAMAAVASLSVLFALGSIACAALDCCFKIKNPGTLLDNIRRQAHTVQSNPKTTNYQSETFF